MPLYTLNLLAVLQRLKFLLVALNMKRHSSLSARARATIAVQTLVGLLGVGARKQKKTFYQGILGVHFLECLEIKLSICACSFLGRGVLAAEDGFH